MRPGDIDRTSELARTEGRNAVSCAPSTNADIYHCTTCGDDGIPMRVLAVDESRCLALCEDGSGAHGSVEIALVAPVAPGDTLLVHAGTALTRVVDTVA